MIIYLLMLTHENGIDGHVCGCHGGKYEKILTSQPFSFN